MRVLAVLVFVALVATAGWTVQALQQPVGTGGVPLAVVVMSGETPGHALRRLDTEQRLDYSLPLRAWVRLQDPSKVQAGEYEVPPGASAADLVRLLFSGRSSQRAFVVVEGWSIFQLRAALAAESRLRQETAALDAPALMALLGRPGLHPEGRFAPDTYFFSPWSSSDADILRQALAAQDERVSRVWAGRAPELPYASADQMLVMASIVEKETGQAGERAEIAGVFVRRLGIGMRLQTDPTVIYGLGPAFDGNLTRAQLQAPTPWNTYTNAGLPPTPIAMPGLAALEAAAHPAAGTALYFVGRGDGSHQFSATLDEHNAAVREYQLRRRADYHSAPAP